MEFNFISDKDQSLNLNGFFEVNMEFNFNPELSQASTIPANWYRDASRYNFEIAKLWPQTWQYVGSRESLCEHGSYLTFSLGNENIVVVNDQGQIRAHSNVCRHRAGSVARGCGKANKFTCEYHQWTYGLDGKLMGTPEFQGVKDFTRENYSLPSWQVNEWGPLLFVSRNPLCSFREWMGDIPEEVKYIDAEKMKFYLRKDYPVQANWKIYVDNYLEGYHINAVHPALAKELDYSKYEVITHKWYSSQKAPPVNGAQYYDGGSEPGAHYFWNFPNFMLNIYQGLVQTNQVIPTGIDSCIVRFEWYVRPSEEKSLLKKMNELVRFSDLIQEEDKKICESVQKNILSEDYHQGRFSVKRENGVHHFHGLLAQFTRV